MFKTMGSGTIELSMFKAPTFLSLEDLELMLKSIEKHDFQVHKKVSALRRKKWPTISDPSKYLTTTNCAGSN